MNMINRPLNRGMNGVHAEVGADVKAILAEMNGAFAKFQEANDAKIAELKTGLDDVVSTEKVDRINANVSALQAKLEDALKQVAAASDGADQAMKFAQRLGVGGDGGDAGSAGDLAANARAFAAARSGKPLNETENVDVEGYQRYCAAFTTFLRRGGSDGERLPENIHSELMSGSDSNGGFFVPAEMSNRVQTRMFETSNIRAIATVESTTSDIWELAVDTDEANSGGWEAEREAPSETDTPRIGKQKIEIHTQFAEPYVTQRVLEDANRDVAGWLGDKIADKLGRTENTAFVIGSGSGQPRGIFSYGVGSSTTNDGSRAWGVLQHVISGSTTGFPTVSGSDASDPDALITLISKLKPHFRSNARFLMNRATEAAIRKLKDTDGRYLVGMGDIRDGVIGFNLFGYPMATGEDVADIASDAFALAFGDFAAGYTIVDRLGLQILRDPYTSKPFVKFYTTKRVGGDVTDFDAIKLMKFAA